MNNLPTPDQIFKLFFKKGLALPKKAGTESHEEGISLNKDNRMKLNRGTGRVKKDCQEL